MCEQTLLFSIEHNNAIKFLLLQFLIFVNASSATVDTVIISHAMRIHYDTCVARI